MEILIKGDPEEIVKVLSELIKTTSTEMVDIRTAYGEEWRYYRPTPTSGTAIK